MQWGLTIGVPNYLRTLNDSGPDVLYNVLYVVDIGCPVTDTFLCVVYGLNLIVNPLCGLQTFRSHCVNVVWNPYSCVLGT
jgi:hypothetical protein